tara:strand:+ start:2107 stop:3780 length:1674 start_codon:yes stop_codon:yes gene_type:complete
VLFGEFNIDEIDDGILAHSIRLKTKTFKKGRKLSPEDILLLKNEGFITLICAKLENGDIEEDVAADRIGSLLTGNNLSKGPAHTGRCNIYAECPGLVTYKIKHVNSFNNIDEAITLGLVPPLHYVNKGQMVATLKIIPFAVSEDLITKIEQFITDLSSIIEVKPFIKKHTILVQTKLSGIKESVLDATQDVTNSRLLQLSNELFEERRCTHDIDALAKELKYCMSKNVEVTLIAGASAIVDRRDVVPAAIEKAGGSIEHFGMPVDPGNLILIGSLGNMFVIGIPGCARSPKLNGFDWVLQRVFTDMPVNSGVIMDMGAGGLLKDIPTRPLPRSRVSRLNSPKNISASTSCISNSRKGIHALLLGAGQSRRMGRKNKLLAPINNVPMIRHVAENILESKIDSLTIVTGYQSEKIHQALKGLSIKFAYNANYREGLSRSLNIGVRTLQKIARAVIICLGDMPEIKASHINQLIDAYDPSSSKEICVPKWNGRRGNPVLISHNFFHEITTVEGDTGAKSLIKEYAENVIEVEMKDDSILLDLDTPEELKAFITQSSSGDS